MIIIFVVFLCVGAGATLWDRLGDQYEEIERDIWHRH